MAVQKVSQQAQPAPAPSKGPVSILVGTRKGAFILRGGKSRRKWELDGPKFLGNIVYHVVLDPRDGRTMLLAARTGHLGPTVFRSTNFGKTWTEAEKPPMFPKASKGKEGRVVSHVFWLAPGHASEPNVWYAGTSPQGLFRSEDGGKTWEGVKGFNEHPMRAAWCGDGQQAPPGGATLHSISIDPRDLNHIYVGLSGGGVFESTDKGADWKPLNKGCSAEFLPDPNAEFGHDPHCLQMHPLMPDRLYQQNHCGIYRMDRGEGVWVRIGEKMPKSIGDVGFPITLHPRDSNVAWVFPMDATEVWPRTNPSGKAAAYVTRNGGKTWQRLDNGLPQSQAWWNVKRQAMAVDIHEPVGVYFGTTHGEVWSSRDEGEKWTCLVRNLPEVFAVEVAELSL
jgi:photosystem II stability/assembly factor-like uncharacterized protein